MPRFLFWFGPSPLAVLVPMRLTPGHPQLRRSPHNHHTDTRRPT